MSFQTTKSNLRSYRPTATGAYAPVAAAGAIETYLEIIATDGPLLVSIGYETPSDAVAVPLPTGASLKFENVIPSDIVAVKSQSGDVTYSLIAA